MLGFFHKCLAISNPLDLANILLGPRSYFRHTFSYQTHNLVFENSLELFFLKPAQTPPQNGPNAELYSMKHHACSTSAHACVCVCVWVCMHVCVCVACVYVCVRAHTHTHTHTLNFWLVVRQEFAHVLIPIKFKMCTWHA